MTLLSRRRFALLLASLCLALLTPVLAHADLMRAIQARSGLMDEILLQADQPRYSNEVWVLIDKQASSLSLYRGNTLLERFSPISLGRGGAETQRLRGGRVTPLGEFRVTRFNFDSKFHTFIGLDYPTPTHARMALQTGIYSQREYDDYFAYYRRHGRPPQDTVLGGYIGIHGVGVADADIHRRFDWTDGCVAVTDGQVDTLSSMIDIGTRVVIR
ncbi:L,D-transpeptidase family protein [Halomonas caseinilytica]|uniref:L,D-transpeptidase catalytic domain n=1 Tax=Halomonas caseinilytica TaxID=438744 RepID=A0A1M6UA63_9GAMM|nr:L,D-transpeptidase [Halomonas caseinilytica]SEM95398.1 L,D-transpeptidase catalytic domain [Halomonas caseinilytica]SHK66050.1 L,D-transpeptidase catalytic domain [Halomonas caseinilytica]